MMMAFVIVGTDLSVPNLVLLNILFERRLLVILAATDVTIAIYVGVLFYTVLVSVCDGIW